MYARRFSYSSYSRLTAAFARSRELAGSRDSVSEHTRVSGSQLANYEDQSKADCCVPIDIALDIDDLSGSDLVLSEMAAIKGYSLVPSQEVRSSQSVPEHIASLSKEFGEAIEAIGADPTTPREKSNCVSELLDLQAVVTKALQAMHSGHQDSEAA